MTEEEILKVFSEVGTIKSMKINKSKKRIDNEDIVAYQFGYILYEKIEEAQAAIKKFDDSNIFGNKPIKVELWMSKDEKD